MGSPSLVASLFLPSASISRQCRLESGVTTWLPVAHAKAALLHTHSTVLIPPTKPIGRRGNPSGLRRYPWPSGGARLGCVLLLMLDARPSRVRSSDTSVPIDLQPQLQRVGRESRVVSVDLGLLKRVRTNPRVRVLFRVT